MFKIKMPFYERIRKYLSDNLVNRVILTLFIKPLGLKSMQIEKEFTDFISLLKWRAKTQPAKTAFIFLDENCRETEKLSYAELNIRAEAIAAELTRRNAFGERVLLLFEPGLEFICAFMGCLYAGAIAVPAYPPDPTRLNKSLPRLAAIVKDCEARFVLTSARLQWLIKAFYFVPFDGRKVLRKLKLIVTDKFKTGSAAVNKVLDKDTVAFLQYTSGSTGEPKGVIITQENIIENSFARNGKCNARLDSIGVFWLPFYHDMGLIGSILGTIYAGNTSVLISPITFLKNPFIWIKALSLYKGTITAVPNFALELSARKSDRNMNANIDLSSLETVILGGEPVRKETLENFYAAFSDCGLRYEALNPAYGLAEATLFVSGEKFLNKPKSRNLNAKALEKNRIEYIAGDTPVQSKEVVSCGTTGVQGELIIVNPETRKRLSADQIGEIWVKGPYVGLGYWQKPELTREIFQATLDCRSDCTYLRTGDLGFIDQAGELYFTGRLKDLIRISEKKYYPQDIELAVEQAHPSVRKGCIAAFSVEENEIGQLIIVTEVKEKDKTALADICKSIANEVMIQYGLQPASISLVKPQTINKTSSGKIQRWAARGAFLRNELKVIFQQEFSQYNGINSKTEIIPVLPEMYQY
jgi:acyl-CoA synthetase (AMP-forming)/AMP-acid ligase II